jgi:hypothetical protein
MAEMQLFFAKQYLKTNPSDVAISRQKTDRHDRDPETSLC